MHIGALTHKIKLQISYFRPIERAKRDSLFTPPPDKAGLKVDLVNSRLLFVIFTIKNVQK
jgi:hypothetical protein